MYCKPVPNDYYGPAGGAGNGGGGPPPSRSRRRRGSGGGSARDPPTGDAANGPGGASHLARIHGTEEGKTPNLKHFEHIVNLSFIPFLSSNVLKFIIEDKVNCPFFFKIGACRHGDRCSRLHHRPAFSQTVLIRHIYPNPVREAEISSAMRGEVGSAVVDEAEAEENFLQFYE